VKGSKSFKTYWDKFGTVGILLVILIGLSLASPRNRGGWPIFLTPENITQIGLQSTVYLLLAYGEFFTILIAGIDLSVGAVAGLSGMIMAMLMMAGVPTALAVFIGLLAGTVFGAINGLLINTTDLHPFVVTLGTQAIFRGTTLIISDGRPVFGFSQTFQKIAGYVGPVPIPLIIAAAIAAVLFFFTSRTIVGRNIYALGGSKQSAWYSGINIKLHTLIVHTLSGLMAGCAGMVMTARIGAAEPLAGQGYETFTIAACIIGGTSFFGGKGKILTVIIGGLIIGSISNGLNILNVQSFWQQVVMGTLIIGSVALDRLVSRSAERGT
jgi:D-allose transport system permease protein